MTPLKPIDTRYAGHLFRSRLEARWAVFFDCLDLEWQYEVEGFQLPGDIYYLPDFRITTPQGHARWVEVKPAHVKSDPKFDAFVEALHPDGQVTETTDAALVSGSPLEWLIADNSFCPRCGMPLQSLGADDVSQFNCQPCDWETPCGGGHSSEPTGVKGIAWRPHKGWIELDGREPAIFQHMLKKAATAAQQARFEHGQSGAILNY